MSEQKTESGMPKMQFAFGPDDADPKDLEWRDFEDGSLGNVRAANKEEIREKILIEAMADLKNKAGHVIGSIMSDLYADYLPHVASDTESNISYRVEGCIRNMIAGNYERAAEGDDLVWIGDGYGNSHLINLASYNLTLKPLCDLMGETIQANRIKQLEDKIESLQNQLNDSYRR